MKKIILVAVAFVAMGAAISSCGKATAAKITITGASTAN